MKQLILESGIRVVWAAALLRRRTFADVTQRLGTLAPDAAIEPSPLTEQQIPQAVHVGWAVRRVSHLLVGLDTCFVQALAASAMLRRRGIPSVAVFGAQPPGAGSGLEAHVWVRAGSWTLTGGDVAHRYEPLAAYVAPGARVDPRGTSAASALERRRGG